MTVGITELPPEGMQLGGVALAGDPERGTRTTEGLSLLFTAAGITVLGPQPQIERLLVWSGLDSVTCHGRADQPDGSTAAVMELTSGGQVIRFLLPSPAVSPGQVAYLDQALPAWLARYRGTPAAPAAPPRAPATTMATPGAVGAPGAGADAGPDASFAAPEPALAGVAASAARAGGPSAPPTAWDALSEEPEPDDGARRGSRRRSFSRRKQAAVAAGSVATVAAAGTTDLTPPPPAPDAPVAPPSAPEALVTPPPADPPVDPVPLGIQPPPAVVRPASSGAAPDAATTPRATPPVAATPAAGTPVADGGGATPTPGDAGVVLAAPARGRRRGVIAAVAAGVVLVAAVAGVAVIRSRGPAPAQDPQTTAAADSRTARLVTLGLRDLPAGWAVAPTATAPVRPPLPAPAVQSGADSTLAICLGSDPATVAGLLGQVPLPGTAATYASPTFQSPTGPAVAMSGRTTVLSDPAQIRTLGSTLTGPNFLPCLTQYEGTMIAGAVTGATVATRPVALPAPAGTQAVGVVSTYTLPGVGTEVVGQAFIFGGAVLSVMVPTTSGADIPADVFSAAYGRVAARVAAAAK